MVRTNQTSILRLLTLLLAAVCSQATQLGRPPSTGQEWQSIGRGMEFQPNHGRELPSQQQAALRRAQGRFLKQQQQQQQQHVTTSRTALDTQETYYDAYAQAWRYVGFFTDCSPSQDHHRRQRRLNGDNQGACQRYLLWAAYADLDYAGKGVGNYQYYDTYNQRWDASACQATGNGNKDEEGNFIVDDTLCKKMDCHLSDTSWQLLGYFKEPEYTGWFEQLFKHEGYCVWQGDEYQFMYENYGSWPEGCSETETYLKDGTLLYTDTTASANGTMGYGLFTDARCSADYTGDEVTAQQVINAEGDDYLDAESLDYWNKAMEIYRVCQPCQSYALSANYGGNDRRQRRERALEENGAFQCNDAAGYTNVNQCMKFSAKTDMEYASFEEVLAAAHQGGITSLTIQGRTFGEYRAGYAQQEATFNSSLLWSSVVVLALGIVSFASALSWSCCRQGGSWRRHRRNRNAYLKQPLVYID